MVQKKKNPSAPAAEEYRLLETSEITVSEDMNSRFALAATDTLEEDILKRGQVHPVICRRFGSEIILTAGYRRHRAIAKINEIPGLLSEPMKIKVLLRDIDEKEAFLISISENQNRQNISILDAGWQASQLMKKYDMTQKEVAEHYGKNQSWVSRVCKLLTLDPDVREQISSGALSYTDALELLSIEDKTERSELAEKMISSDSNGSKVTREEVRSKTRSGKKKVGKVPSVVATDDRGRITLKQSRELFERWGTPNVERGEKRKPIHAICSAIASYLDGKMQEKSLRKVLTGYLK